VLEVEPQTAALRIARDRAELVERGGDWVVVGDLETVHECRP
jgi:hypothetical protein